jgi:hypothetical protein
MNKRQGRQGDMGQGCPLCIGHTITQPPSIEAVVGDSRQGGMAAAGQGVQSRRQPRSEGMSKSTACNSNCVLTWNECRPMQAAARLHQISCSTCEQRQHRMTSQPLTGTEERAGGSGSHMPGAAQTGASTGHDAPAAGVHWVGPLCSHWHLADSAAVGDHPWC